ncbi:MAG: hypothetical protein LUE89_11310 [Clostridiales bacterium]|nr:hypothetical protein [Clostridiales bacterium]
MKITHTLAAVGAALTIGAAAFAAGHGAGYQAGTQAATQTAAQEIAAAYSDGYDDGCCDTIYGLHVYASEDGTENAVDFEISYGDGTGLERYGVQVETWGE